MSMSNHDANPDSFNTRGEPGDVPPELARDITRLLGGGSASLHEFDTSVLEDARRTMRARRTRQLILRAAPLAAAAGLALAASLVWPTFLGQSRGGGSVARNHTAPGHSLASNEADINADGVLDILDALAFAQAIESQPSSSTLPDLNADGVVNRADADRIASLVVALRQPGEGRS
jgi:hypothetical protein